jgi:hypothetical protein
MPVSPEAENFKKMIGDETPLTDSIFLRSDPFAC